MKDPKPQTSPDSETSTASGGDETPGSPQAAPSLEEQLQTVTAERDQYLDQWTRSRAELENYRRRVQREIDEARQYQSLPLVRDLLPGLDNLDRAVQAAETSQNLGELLAGLKMVLAQFESILAAHAAVPIESVGVPFDPNLHEAIQQLPSADQPPMTVLAELERGYKLRDRVVRPSKVIVSSGPPPEG